MKNTVDNYEYDSDNLVDIAKLIQRSIIKYQSSLKTMEEVVNNP